MLPNECDSESELEDEAYDTVSEDESEENDSEDGTDESNKVSTAINQLKETWKSLSTPINETESLEESGMVWPGQQSAPIPYLLGNLFEGFLWMKMGQSMQLLCVV